MIYHIGSDIIEIERFNSDICKSDSFLLKIFTKPEIEYCSKFKKADEHYAARFAGKEAVIKAFAPCGIRLAFHDIEITNHESGYPVASINHADAGRYQVSLSLSHSGSHAMAVALVVSLQSDTGQ